MACWRLMHMVSRGVGVDRLEVQHFLLQSKHTNLSQELVPLLQRMLLGPSSERHEIRCSTGKSIEQTHGTINTSAALVEYGCTRAFAELSISSTDTMSGLVLIGALLAELPLDIL